MGSQEDIVGNQGICEDTHLSGKETAWSSGGRGQTWGFRTDPDFNLDPTICCHDLGKISEILYNLISSSVK